MEEKIFRASSMITIMIVSAILFNLVFGSLVFGGLLDRGCSIFSCGFLSFYGLSRCFPSVSTVVSCVSVAVVVSWAPQTGAFVADEGVFATPARFVSCYNM